MSRRDRRSSDSDGGGGGDWLTTYSDLVTLLLCFFVLLFSFAEIDAEKFRQISNSLRVEFSGGDGVLDGTTAIDPPIPQEHNSVSSNQEMSNLYSQLKEYSNNQELKDKINVIAEERGIVIRFEDNVFFDSGSSNIKEASKPILDAASNILNQQEFSRRQIKIEGHTDSDPIVSSGLFPTNWELSAARATNVLRYMVEENNLDASRVSSSGYGEHRPLVDNDSNENKAINRRVDIVILKDIYEDLEPERLE